MKAATKSPTRAARPAPVDAAARLAVVVLALEAAGLGDSVPPEDVLSIHVGVRTIGIRRRVRGRSGRIVPGHTLTTTHDVLLEPLED